MEQKTRGYTGLQAELIMDCKAKLRRIVRTEKLKNNQVSLSICKSQATILTYLYNKKQGGLLITLLELVDMMGYEMVFVKRNEPKETLFSINVQKQIAANNLKRTNARRKQKGLKPKSGGIEIRTAKSGRTVVIHSRKDQLRDIQSEDDLLRPAGDKP